MTLMYNVESYVCHFSSKQHSVKTISNDSFSLNESNADALFERLSLRITCTQENKKNVLKNACVFGKKIKVSTRTLKHFSKAHCSQEQFSSNIQEKR